jgi:K(+)-stimulated pyrophosphate-energized sodium pump
MPEASTMITEAPQRLTESAIVLPTLGPRETMFLYLVLASAIIAIVYGWVLARRVARQDAGSAEMQSVSAAIQEGALAYLSRQIKTMIWFVIAITIGLFFLYRGVNTGLANQGMLDANQVDPLSIGIAVAFLMGVFASYGAGYVGMRVAVQANVRVAAAALTSFKRALETAFQAGTVSGMFTVGLGLLGATVIFLIFKENAMKVLVGFGFGGCLAALFMRIGGGIFTKAADVGADLVGKVEKGIPEDDPRNAATIADNVGDNVGDCAGMAADVFESYEVTLVAAIILGAATMLDPQFKAVYGAAAGAFALKLIIYPLLVRAVGVFASIIGTWAVRGKDDAKMDPMKPINVGFNVAAVMSVIGFTLVNYFYLRDPVTNKPDFRFALATLMGIILAVVISKLTEHFTSTEKGPVTEIAHSTRTGTATMILSGLAEGLESSVWAVVAIAATIFGSMVIFQGSISLAAYGVALSGLGLLTTTGFILAMDTFGPISDNANGIFEMSGALKEDKANENVAASRIVAKLDAVGNTTKALTKGFAIATAVVAAVSLFRSFVDEAKLAEIGIQVNLPSVFIGLLIGGAVPFLFSSFAIRAVTRAAGLLVHEVRRQFREIPGIMEGTSKPEYAKCVSICTAAAQKELLGPAILAIATPILVAFGLGYSNPSDGAAALGGYLAGAILSGQLMAVFMANTGGAWDNAKKKIEEGLFGGKGTEFHKSAVTGDTVGDPLKDTAGPALNPLIKVMNLVGILIAPMAIAPISVAARVAIILVTLALLTVAVMFSKRGSVVTEEVEAEVAVATK